MTEMCERYERAGRDDPNRPTRQGGERNAMTLVRCVQFCFEPMAIACDGKCHLAWGINWHGKKGKRAPENPGTSEGGDMKPRRAADRLNKWCCRECERCVSADYRGPTRRKCG